MLGSLYTAATCNKDKTHRQKRMQTSTNLSQSRARVMYQLKYLEWEHTVKALLAKLYFGLIKIAAAHQSQKKAQSASSRVSLINRVFKPITTPPPRRPQKRKKKRKKLDLATNVKQPLCGDSKIFQLFSPLLLLRFSCTRVTVSQRCPETGYGLMTGTYQLL